jgi:transcriptional regulator with XRE-family HTH domain
MRLGIVLEHWRTIKRLSGPKAAEQIGISAAALAQLESGKDVTGKNLGAVLAWLVGEDDPAEQAAPQLSLAAPERAANG